jgi:hypothetical protein
VPHAATDTPPPRRKRRAAPPPRVPTHDTPPPRGPAPTTAQQGVAELFGHAPNHDTPPHPPAPTYGPGRISRPTSTLDRVLAAGKGPLALPKGKIDIPQASHATPLPTVPQFQPPARGGHRDATQQEEQSAIARGLLRGKRMARQYPSWAESGIQQASVADSLTRLAMGANLDSGTTQRLLDALSNLPDEQQARVIQSLPGVNDETKRTIHDLQRLVRPGGFQGLANNFVSDALRTPQGIFLGGAVTAQALGQAAQGNTEPIRQVAGATISPFTSTKNFKDFAYNHPFQLLLTASAAGRAAGAAGGAAARTGVLGSRAAEALSGDAPRAITRNIGTREGGAGEDITRTLGLGTYSKNAAEQGVQRIADQIPGLYRSRVSRQARQIQQTTRTERDVMIRDRIEPVMRALRRTKEPDQQAAIYAHAQGINPTDLASHYATRVDELTNEVATATGAARSRATRDLATAKNALKTWQRVVDKVGDAVTPQMQNLLDAARSGVSSREADLIKGGHITRNEAARSPFLPQEIIGSTSTRESPFYIHHELAQRRGGGRVFGRGSGSGGVQGPTTSLEHRTGGALASGNIDFSARPFLRNLAEPGNAAAAVDELQVLRSRFGTPVQAGDHLRSDEVLMPRDTASPSGRAEGAGNPASIINANFFETDRGVVPPGDWVAVPRAAAEQTQRSFLRGPMTRSQRGVRTATRAFKWNALLTRPAWLVSNVVGNTAEAALAGVGPKSLYRALDRSGTVGRRLPGRDYGGVIPRNVEQAGFFTRQLAGRKGLLGMSKNPLVAGNVTHENWLRRAVYLRHALPEYGKDIHALTVAKTAEERAPRVVNLVDRFLGNFAHQNLAESTTLAFPFARWLWFITNQTLHELPLHHPGRALLLYRLGTLGEIASEQSQGLANQSTEGGIPLPRGLLDILGQGRQGIAGPVTPILRTGALNPWATVSQLAGFSNTEPTGQPSFSGAFSALNPFAQAVYNTATGREFSNPEFSTTQNPNLGTRASFFGNELLNLLPVGRLALGSTRFGQAPSSPLSQPKPSFWTRLLGYNVAGVSPVDTTLMNAKNLNNLIRRLGEER